MHYKKCISISPFHANAHNNLGMSYFDKGLLDTAISHFKYAIDINPFHTDAHNNLGIAYGDKGLIDQANAEIRKSMKFR
jgi:tetratricopeptide (TPR) repeat protein